MSMSLPVQTRTANDLSGYPKKQLLVDRFCGKPLNALRTPAAVIDRAVFSKNCAKMHENARQWGASFRAHVKTHKTVEGTRLQLVSSANQTHAVVVSTLIEAHEIIAAGLVADGTVNDILYGLPLPGNKIEDISKMVDEIKPFGGVVRILLDHPDQIRFLEAFEKQRDPPRQWSAFIKVDAGSKRAGLEPASPLFESLLTDAFASPVISVYGFYCHAGHAYGSTSLSAASAFLSSEVDAVNTAAGLALSILSGSPNLSIHGAGAPFILSVGSTPTAHAATAETRAQLASMLNGSLELHAGNYPLLDLQQMHTSLVDSNRVAQSVMATVISYYPGRGENGTDEAMCDAGGLAMSKDTGPSGGFGEVIGRPWRLSRISQEHGILTKSPDAGIRVQRKDEGLKLGEIVHIVGQHACLTLAAYPWYYIVDSEGESRGELVEDVWVPWKGW